MIADSEQLLFSKNNRYENNSTPILMAHDGKTGSLRYEVLPSSHIATGIFLRVATIPQLLVPNNYMKITVHCHLWLNEAGSLSD